MGYDIDILGVGDESKCGDAIAIRWGNLYGERHEQCVILIDGGFMDTGKQIVEHIKTYYNTNEVDLVISTHPDQDHINGLEFVLDKLKVNELWIHKPWDHNQGLSDKFKDGRITDRSVGQLLKENLESAASLVSKAKQKNIKIKEPFSEISLERNNGKILVLGPTKEFYESLISEFDGMPQTQTSNTSLLGNLNLGLRQVKKIIKSVWGHDELDDNGLTSAKNNTSAITLLNIEDSLFLFTADAGIPALIKASEQFDKINNNAKLKYMQIPHHGSRRNIGPKVLNRLIGIPIPEGEKRNIKAIVSTAKKSEPKHPRKSVINAFIHRGVKVFVTRGITKHFYKDSPTREGWTPIKSEEYSWEYTEEN